MNCPLCHLPNQEPVEVAYPFIRHLDFETVSPDGRLAQCPRCRLIFNIFSQEQESRLAGYFADPEYASSQQTIQTVNLPQFHQPVTRSFLQAEILSPLLGPKPAVLDLGCFDGRLLSELGARLNQAQLHGFDVNPCLAEVFPATGNYRFWLGDLSAVTGSFDLICLSHSLAYLPDLHRLAGQLSRLVAPGGFVFVQVANLAANPCLALFGDQRYLFSPAILTNFFNRLGFELKILETEWFPRELLGLARPMETLRPKAYLPDLDLTKVLGQLDRMAQDLAEATQGPVAVLGATANAAFAHCVLGSRVACFVDENPHKVGWSFRGVEIIHPADLTDGQTVLLPYGPSAEAMRERLARLYRARFVAI